MKKQKMKKLNFVCEKCKTSKYKNKITTFPIFLPGKQINVQKVSVRECLKCGFQIPTEKGYEKLERCTNAFAFMMLK